MYKVILFLLLVSFGYAQNQPDRLVRRVELNYITPEMYNAVGDGATNDAGAIYNAIAAALSSNPEKVVLFQKIYNITAPVEVDLNGKDITIKFDAKAKITSDYEEAGAYNTLQGLLNFTNGGKIVIEGMNIESYNTGLSYYDGLLIQDSEEIYLNNVTSKYAGQNGIRVVSADNLFMQDCKADSNLYAGLHVNNVKHATVIGGSYSYNGSAAYLNGYGITFSHQFFTTGVNEDVTITGVQANYNYRKGIDVHGGIGVNIANNFVKGFCTAGIYAVGGAGGEVDDRFEVRDIIIQNNVVDVDSVWYATLDFSGYKGTYGSSIGRFGTTGILTGAYEPITGVAPMEDRGSYKVINNVIKNLVAYDADTLMSDYGVKSFVGRASTVELINNTVYNSKLTLAPLSVVAGNSASEANTVRIIDNTIDSCYSEEDGIIVTAGQSIGITGNHFSNFVMDTAASRGAAIVVSAYLYSHIEGVNISGNFSNNTVGRYGILVYSDTTYSMDLSITNNILKGTYTQQTISSLASPLGTFIKDNIGQSNFGTNSQDKGQQSYSQLDKVIAETGSVSYAIELDEDTTHLKAFTVENTFLNGHLFADIEITAVRAPTASTSYNTIIIYRDYARSYYNATDTVFTTGSIDTTVIDGDSTAIANIKPVISWVGTDLIRELQIAFPANNITYSVYIRFTSFGLKAIYND